MKSKSGRSMRSSEGTASHQFSPQGIAAPGLALFQLSGTDTEGFGTPDLQAAQLLLAHL